MHWNVSHELPGVNRILSEGTKKRSVKVNIEKTTVTIKDGDTFKPIKVTFMARVLYLYDKGIYLHGKG